MSFLCKWFGIGCPKPTPPEPPTPPSPPSLRAVGVVVSGVAGATVKLDNAGAPFVGVTNKDGETAYVRRGKVRLPRIEDVHPFDAINEE